MKKFIGWISFVPVSFLAYILVNSFLMVVLPYIARFIFFLLGFDYTPEPYLFEYQYRISQIRINVTYSIEKYVTLTVVSLISYIMAGGFAGAVANYLCPSKKSKVISLPVIIFLSLMLIPYLFFIWSYDFIYRSIITIISAVSSLIVCFIICETKESSDINHDM